MMFKTGDRVRYKGKLKGFYGESLTVRNSYESKNWRGGGRCTFEGVVGIAVGWANLEIDLPTSLENK